MRSPLKPTHCCVPIRGKDGLIGDGDELHGTGSVQFICVVPVGRDHAGARSEGTRRNARDALGAGSVCSLDMAGVELSGRGDSLVGGGDDIVGEVDQSAPSWLRQRDQLIGRDLAGAWSR